MKLSWASALQVLALLLGVAMNASADDGVAAAEAHRRFSAGTAAFKAGRFREAALNFEAAAGHKSLGVTLYTAALAWEQAGELDRAADDFSRSLDAGGLTAQQTHAAKERLAAAEAVLGTLRVSAPEGWHVQLDGLTELAVPARLHGSAGTHTLLVRRSEAEVVRKDVVLTVGQTTQLELDANIFVPPKPKETKPAPPPPPPPLTEATGFDAVRRPLAFSAFGAGVLAAGSAFVLGMQALGARDAYDAAPTRAGLDHARALQTWTTAGWITAGVFVAAGVTLVVLPSSTDRGKSARLELTPLPRGLSLQGAF